MPTTEKVSKLSAKLRVFIDRLDSLNVLLVHQKINQFYYMQKLSELELLRSKLEDIKIQEENIVRQIALVYDNAGKEWSKDVRWLNQQIVENNINIPLH